MDLAASVAARSGWLGFPLLQSPALFVDKALGNRELHRRVRSLLSARRAVSNLPFYFYSNFSSLSVPQELAYMQSQARILQLGLIVIDSPFFVSLYLDRHKLLTYSAILENLRSLAIAANLSILLIHDLARHRTDLAQPLLDLGVDHVLWARSSSGSAVHIHTLASNDQQPISITAQMGDFGFVKVNTSHSSGVGIVGLKVLAYMSSKAAATTKMIVSSVHPRSPRRVSNVIYELLRDGYLSRVNSGGRGSPALYSLAPAGRDVIK